MSQENQENAAIGQGAPNYREALLVSFNAVDELFNEPVGEIVVTIHPEDENGNEMEPVRKAVVFRPCKAKHLNMLTTLIFNVVSGFSDTELIKVLTFVTDEQKRLLAEGVNPYLMNTETLVQKATVEGGTILALFQGALGVIPQFVERFTNLTRDEFDNTDALHSALVVYGIFARNYHFFIQNGPLLGRAFVASLGNRATRNEKKAPQ